MKRTAHKKHGVQKKYKKQRTRRRKRTYSGYRGGDRNLQQVRNDLEEQLTNPQERQSKMLQLVCRDPDNCLALGVYNEQVKLFFNNFKQWNQINTNRMELINSGSNGVVIRVPFTRDGFTAYAALKCSVKPTADNLFYEYCAGQFINHHLLKLPCFIETYGLFSAHNAVGLKRFIREPSGITLNQSQFSLVPNIWQNFQSKLAMSCLTAGNLCLLVQHFKRFYSALSLKQQGMSNHEIYCMLYQVYFALVSINSTHYTYTHYDLHSENVFGYQPFDASDHCILFRYHSSNGQVTEFKSKYIYKIIDYGRNYFHFGKTNNLNSNFIITKMCNTEACGNNCGVAFGYKMIRGTDQPDQESKVHWINPRKHNMSHDLRFARSMLSSNVIHYETNYGTPPIDDRHDKVYNIFQMKAALEHWISMESVPSYIHTWQVAAELDVYEDGRDMQFKTNATHTPVTKPKEADYEWEEGEVFDMSM